MDSVVLKKGCMLNKTIIDSYNVIEKGVKIGHDSKVPYFRVSMDPSGISVVASEHQTGKL
jgi:ADP-glucose pyrophosphorylase